MPVTASNNDRIRELNDRFRQTGVGGTITMTRGVHDLADDLKRQILHKVRTFDAFDADNDPYGEHDFGSFEVGGEKVYWKIDYFDTALEAGSPDPSDPAVTSRVLTIMLSREY